MTKTFSMLTMTAATLLTTAAFATPTVECKVTGVETYITATGHETNGPTLRETKTANETTVITDFTNVTASHQDVNGVMTLTTTGEDGDRTVKLEVSEEQGHGSALKGTYTETRSNTSTQLPVQCTAHH